MKPSGTPVPKKYPRSLKSVQVELLHSNNSTLLDKIIVFDDKKMSKPYKTVERILNRSGTKNEIVIPRNEIQSEFKDCILINRGDLGLSIYENPPEDWQREHRSNGEANDDLVNSYMMLLSRLSTNFMCRTQQDLNVIVDKLKVGKSGKFIQKIAEYQFLNHRALFETYTNGMTWEKRESEPTDIPKISKTLVPRKIRSSLLHNNLEFSKIEVENLNLPSEGYIEITTKLGNTYYFVLYNKPIHKFSNVIFPIHKPGHWALIHINFKKFKIQHYDSMYYKLESKVFSELKKYIKASFEYTYPNIPSTPYMKKWSNVDYSTYNPKVTPKQTGIDCGFFIMEMAKYLVLGWKITKNNPNKKDMANIRRRCVYELYEYCLLKI